MLGYLDTIQQHCITPSKFDTLDQLKHLHYIYIQPIAFILYTFCAYKNNNVT